MKEAKEMKKNKEKLKNLKKSFFMIILVFAAFVGGFLVGGWSHIIPNETNTNQIEDDKYYICPNCGKTNPIGEICGCEYTSNVHLPEIEEPVVEYSIKERVDVYLQETQDILDENQKEDKNKKPIYNKNFFFLGEEYVNDWISAPLLARRTAELPKVEGIDREEEPLLPNPDKTDKIMESYFVNVYGEDFLNTQIKSLDYQSMTYGDNGERIRNIVFLNNKTLKECLNEVDFTGTYFGPQEHDPNCIEYAKNQKSKNFIVSTDDEYGDITFTFVDDMYLNVISFRRRYYVMRESGYTDDEVKQMDEYFDYLFEVHDAEDAQIESEAIE